MSSYPIPNDQMFLEGRNDWYFLTNDSNRVIDQVTGALQLDRKQIDIWARTVEFRMNYFRRNGIKYGHFIIPNKEIVFSEFLPDFIDLGGKGQRPISQLEAAVAAKGLTGLYYLEDLMRSHKSTPDLYRKLDTHWGFPGALLAYRFMMSVLFPRRRNLVLSDSQLKRTLMEVNGDLGIKMSPPRLEETTIIEVAKKKARKVYDNEVTNLGHIQIWERSGWRLPKIVLFHDSFSNWLIPFLAESASRLVCVHMQQVDLDLLRAERPDVVIAETVERFIVQPPNDVSGDTIHEVLHQKGADPAPWASRSGWSSVG